MAAKSELVKSVVTPQTKPEETLTKSVPVGRSGKTHAPVPVAPVPTPAPVVPVVPVVPDVSSAPTAKAK